MSKLISGTIDFEHGPLLRTAVGIIDPRRAAYRRLFCPPPADVVTKLLVDTGATMSCVDQRIVERLDLDPVGERLILTPGAVVAQWWPTYIISLMLWDQQGRKHDIASLEVCATNFFQRPHEGLLGRDVLGSCRFNYNGPYTSFTLEF